MIASPKSKVQSPKSKKSRAGFSNGSAAEKVYCKSCGAVELPAPKWEAYGGRGLCDACDPAEPGAGDASREAPKQRFAAGYVLGTVTPAGIAANDPEALPRSRQAAKEDGPPEAKISPSTTFLCPFEELGRNRFNPREQFDRRELDDLGAKLKRDGQVQAILVRQAGADVKTIKFARPAKWEIVAGERRALAAFHAGLPGVRAEVIEHCDDARACALALAENRDRKDISMVEYARGLQKLADLKGLDPEALAKDQHLSAQHVRNLLRLLKAPEEWQRLVIDGVITGTHLRHAVPYLHVPKIAGKLRERIAKHECDGKLSLGEKDWREEVEEVVHDCAVLANKLLNEKAKAWREKRAAPADGQQAQAASKKQQERERADKQRRIEAIVEHWIGWLCAYAVRSRPDVAGEVALAAVLTPSPLFDGVWGECPWREFLVPDKRQRRLIEFAANCFFDGRVKPERLSLYPLHGTARVELAHWCRELAVDPEDAWRAQAEEGGQSFLGPLTELWTGELDDDDLRDLAQAWKVGGTRELLDKMKVAQLEKLLFESEARVFPMPPQIADVVKAITKGGRRKAEGKSKRKPR